ncbi:MAG: ATP-dependent DNA helicase RecG [Gammaproteobacteria bacterium]|nr:ATP-dependent DNA helicase RecG [Gammaproteobacteria bacterium]
MRAVVSRANAQQEGLSLSSPVGRLKRVSPHLEDLLARLEIRTVQDLLFHLPIRYQDRTRVAPIGTLQAGDEAVIEGEVLLTEIRYGRRRMLLSRLGDGTGTITLRFFHFSARQQEGLARGVRLRCYGEVRGGPGSLEMAHPEYRRADAASERAEEPGLTPVYPVTAGLRQSSLRGLVAQALECSAAAAGEHDPLRELLPAEVIARHGFGELRAALFYLHRPPPAADLQALLDGSHPLRRRLAFEELLAHQLSLRMLRAGMQHHRAPVCAVPGELRARFLAALPFVPTAAQRRVIAEIEADLRRSQPMQRLVQGDVGSGKTVVAAAAVLQAVEAGCQAAVMAPTELLAEQHYRNIAAWLRPLGIEVIHLAGKSRAGARAQALEAIRSGRAAVAVGTHALFQQDVVFAALGLVVVDEQHRFGVHQRLALREKGRDGGRYPHQLIMTATPIPRTLMMTAYADLDCSIIDELPPGRQPVTTVIVPDARRAEVIERVREVCRRGQQAYWVCTLIEESEALQCQAAQEASELLREALPDLAVGLLHGRMKPAEKEAVMAAFKDGAIQLLVATTVIEVGVDVPNAGLMIIENAERLGLAQLHQLRGRVGRGSEKSACVLMYHSPLSERGRLRLAALRDTGDGFEIARRDLELRGPGEILGVRQAGIAQLRTADVVRDQELIPAAGQCAALLLEHYPERVSPLIRRWLGDRPRYGAV